VGSFFLYIRNVAPDLLKFFRGSAPAAAAASKAAVRSQRSSSGLKEFSKSIGPESPKVVLDLGPTSPTNLMRLTGIGHKVYNEDLLMTSLDPRYQIKGADGRFELSPQEFFKDSLVFEEGSLDAVLAWDVADYLPEPLVKPMVDRLHRALKPGGVLLGFFHTREAGPEAPYHRYHITGSETLDVQVVERFKLARVFNNRHIENLFRDFKSVKFFLARDHFREVLVVR
jgi:SAM-dependent methyltransferase